ncbi:MAG: DNA-binding protein [Ruminococcus sp.]|nr:DNA-binding protein [Ruminococcus sp.]MBO5384397.1 DNA-binding protein [Ruminococcus sp.]MBR6669942.1 DNA-binding protein [Ruminococcus sp.]
MSKELKFVLLLDCYGDLLTDKQRETMELYYCEDLSLAEISEPRGITRQAVRDGIKRSEQTLLDIENKLGFASRLSKMRECFEQLKEISDEIGSSEISDKLDKCIEKGLSLL